MKNLLLNFLFAFILLGLSAHWGIAQPFKAISFPQEYAAPTGDTDYSVASSQERSSRIWFVCSDRPNNPTYKKPGGTKVFRTLNFLDKFYVVGEEGAYLQLAKGKGGNISDDILDGEDLAGIDDDETYINGEDYGWIHKKNVLLWRKCLIGINNMDTKAMLLNTVEGIDQGNISVQDLEKVAFYKDSNLRNKSGNIASLFDFFFIYKREGNSVLLGKDNYIKDYYSDFADVIMGWVPAKKVIQWDHRVVAERNWESPAVKERTEKGTKAAVFYKEFDAKTYKQGHSVNNQHVLWGEKEISKKRDPGQRKRFPILRQENGLLEVGAMGQVYNYDGTTDREEYEDILKEASGLKSAKRNINVVFVVDGTKGMDAYWKGISSAIQNSTKYFQTSLNTIKFGAVVYRDKEAGGKVTERKLLNANAAAIVDFFSTANTDYDDADVGDAVHYGIHTAIRSLSLNKEETNFIILVGGAPNHDRSDETQVEEDELIKLMHDYDCHLFAFLVNNMTDDHEELIYQVRNLVLGVAKKKYQKLKSDPKMQGMLAKNGEYLQEPRLAPYPKKQNMYRLERTATMGSIYHAEFETKLQVNDFQTELIKILKEADIQTNQFLNRIERKVWGVGNDKGGVGTADVANFGASFLNFLLRSGLTEDQIAKIRDDNIQLYQPGFTPETVDGHEFPLFKPSLFLTRLELLELYKQMKDFSEASHSVNNARREMQRVWLDILRKYIGSDEKSFLEKNNIDNLEEMDLLSINEKVFGLPGNSSFLEGVKVADITKIDRFTEGDFNRFAARIDKKLQKLGEIVNNSDYEFAFLSNDINYYWISEDFLP